MIHSYLLSFGGDVNAPSLRVCSSVAVYLFRGYALFTVTRSKDLPALIE
jgi:hypothetical protein